MADMYVGSDSTMSDAATAYDVIAYPSHPCPQTHPDNLATLATLFGMRPAPVENCRVLELGCGEGGNLLPMAFALRQSMFVGIDLAASAIGKAREETRALALTNVDFHCADLMEWTPPDGPFDYVIAHGFFSWVPDSVRLRCWRFCAIGWRRRGSPTSATTPCPAAIFAVCSGK